MAHSILMPYPSIGPRSPPTSSATAVLPHGEVCHHVHDWFEQMEQDVTNRMLQGGYCLYPLMGGDVRLTSTFAGFCGI